MANALGQMPNAPLIYVLAQVRFSHVPRMDKRWEDFHEKVFESYPKAETQQIAQIILKDGPPTVGDNAKRWHLTKDSQTTGIIVGADVLLFHTTDYITSNTFLSDLEEVLEAFVAVLPGKGVTVSRLGLRFVDLLLQEGDLGVDQQVIDELQLPKLSNIGEAQRMEQTITYRTPIGGTLRIRHNQSITPDILPADLFPNKLNPPSRIKLERLENSISGTLDCDHFIEQDQAFDINAIIASFRTLHDYASLAFKAVTTLDAQHKWQEEAPL